MSGWISETVWKAAAQHGDYTGAITVYVAARDSPAKAAGADVQIVQGGTVLLTNAEARAYAMAILDAVARAEDINAEINASKQA